MNYRGNNINSRQEACKYLGIRFDASTREIKTAYRELSKKFHPDVNSDPKAKEYFLLINNAYNYLENNPEVNLDSTVRQAKVYGTKSSVRSAYAKQQSMNEEHRRMKEWEEKRRQRERLEKEKNQYKQNVEPKSKEEEVLDKIRAIWLAETIHRQIEHDKIEKEIENKRKLYKAFMKQKLNEEKIDN